MKKSVIILKILYLVPFFCFAQRDSVEMSNFLNFFVKDYLATHGISKINNKVRPQTFSKTNLSYTNWYSIVLKNDTTVFKEEQDKKDFFAKLYENAVELNFANYISESFLVDISRFYNNDSLHSRNLIAISKYPELTKSMIEITTPYFFDNYQKCIIVSYIPNYSRQNSKLYYFKKNQDKWELQKLLFPDFNIDY